MLRTEFQHDAEDVTRTERRCERNKFSIQTEYTRERKNEEKTNAKYIFILRANETALWQQSKNEREEYGQIQRLFFLLRLFILLLSIRMTVK